MLCTRWITFAWILSWAVLATAVQPLHAQGAGPHTQEAVTVAITYFDNTSANAQLDPLRKGVADMLLTDLAVSPLVRLVERDRLEELLKEIELGEGPFMDPDTAQKMGKGLGAELIVTGAFLSMDPQMRIDARVVKVQTGEVLVTAKVLGNTDQFFSLEADLATKLLTGIGLTISPAEKKQINRAPTQSLGAMRDYSIGLDARDRGEVDEAKAAFKRALDVDPSFKSASDAMEGLSRRAKSAFDELDALVK